MTRFFQRPAFLAPLLLLMAAAPAYAQSEPALRTITVNGTGEVTASPTDARVNAGIVTMAETAEEALARNNDAMEHVFAFIETFGIDRKRVQTAQFSITPETRRNGPAGGGRSGEAEIVGYRVTNSVSVKMDEIGRMGALLDGLVKAGANQIGAIEFTIEDQAALMDEARRRAVADARHRAGILADAAGAGVGTVHSIEESGVVGPVVRFERAMSAGAVPIAEGELTLTANVRMVYALK